MAPKKKGKKKDKKADADPLADIPVELRSLGVDQLRERIDAYQQRLNKSMSERNYMQLERDMVNRFYEVTKDESGQLDAALLLKDQEIETSEKNHQVEIRVYEQKIRHLQYEHKRQKKLIQSEGEDNIQKEKDDHIQHVQGLAADKTSLQYDFRELGLANEEEVKRIEDGFDRNFQKLKEQFDRNHTQLQTQYEAQLESLREDLELRRKVEIHEIEERKNQHINDLMKNHQEAFDQIKAYYNDITHDNLQLIRSLKEEINEMKQREKTHHKKMLQLQAERKQLAEPLAQKEKLRAELTQQLKNYTKDKMALKNLKSRCVDMEQTLKDAKQDYRALEERFRKVEKERDDLYKRFNKGVKEIRRRAEFKNIVLEKKLDLLTSQMNEKQAQLQEVLRTAQVDPTTVANISTKLDQALGSKNRLIKELQFEVHRATKTYNDTIKVYEEKLKECGVPLDEVSFEPLQTVTSLMPAGLVTKPAF